MHSQLPSWKLNIISTLVCNGFLSVQKEKGAELLCTCFDFLLLVMFMFLCKKHIWVLLLWISMAFLCICYICLFTIEWESSLSVNPFSDPHTWLPPIGKESLFALLWNLQRRVIVAPLLMESSTSPQCLLWTLVQGWLLWWFSILTGCQYILLSEGLGLKLESQSSTFPHRLP